MRWPNALALGSTEIYLTTYAGLIAIGKSDGTPRVIDPELTGVSHAIAVDETHVYWSGSYGGPLMRASITAETPEVLASGVEVSGIAFHSNAVYWTSWGEGTISTLPKSGGTPTVLTSEAHSPSALAVDDTSIYWTEDVSDGGGRVVSMPLGGGTPLTLASGQNGPRGMTINATYVYWTTTLSNALSRVPLNGGELEVLSDDDTDYWGNVVLDDAYAYWVGHAVMKMGLDGGETERLPGDDSAKYVAIDETSVYFVNHGEGPSNENGTLVKLTPK